ncbi:hypothetical protein [Methanobrevibacter curvatus]|nr:hypothetical protein [Methanobrevibacter curvatus]MDR3063611.1 hypothetical protein [Methanobrevibacter sp.]
MEFRDLIFIIIAILIGVVIFQVFVWLLPIVVVILIAIVVYAYLKSNYLR